MVIRGMRDLLVFTIELEVLVEVERPQGDVFFLHQVRVVFVNPLKSPTRVYDHQMFLGEQETAHDILILLEIPF